MTITAHTLVKNEAKFVWYSVMSVINHVDKVLLWDTGSTDGTLEIIREIQKVGKDKISFREYGAVSAETFTKVRQEILDTTDTDWFIVVDGDEIWWESAIKEVTEEIRRHPNKIESIVVPTINLIGDIYHYQEEEAGQYHLAGRVGHLNLRAVNKKIPGLHSAQPHGTWGWVDGDCKMIQDRDPKKILFVNAPYLHASFLPRSGESNKEQDVPKRKMKRKFEMGIPFPRDFYYPEVFFRPRPSIVPSVWEKMGRSFAFRSRVETPLRKLKRRILPGKVGY